MTVTSFQCVRCDGTGKLYWSHPCGFCEGSGFLTISNREHESLGNIVETVEDNGGILVIPGSVNSPGKRGPIKIGTLQGLAAKGLLDCITVSISPWGVYRPTEPRRTVHVRVAKLAYDYLAGRDLASTVSGS